MGNASRGLEGRIPPVDGAGAAANGVHVARGGGALPLLGEAYDRLCADLSVPIYSRTVWLESWLAARPEVEPVAVAVGDTGCWDAAVLLALVRRRFRTDVTLLGGDDLDLASLPARDEAAAGRLAGALAGVIAGVARPWRVRFAQVPPDDPTIVELGRLLPVSGVVAGDGVPVARIGDDRSVGALLSKQLRYEVRRMRRRLAEAHEVGLEVVTGETEVRALVEPMIRLRRERDHDLGRPSTLDSAAGQRFFREIVARHAREGRCEVGVLHVDGRLACYVVGLRQDGTYLCWDQRIASAWSQYSPGKIVYAHVIEHALSIPDCTLIDFGRGQGETKLRYANDTVPTETFLAWSAPLWRRIEDFGRSTAARAKAYKDAHPRLAARYGQAKRSLLRRRGTDSAASA